MSLGEMLGKFTCEPGPLHKLHYLVTYLSKVGYLRS